MQTKEEILENRKQFRNKMRSSIKIDNPILSYHGNISSPITPEYIANQIQPEDQFLQLFDEHEIIGQGAHAIVKRCTRKGFDQEYAVKILKTKDPEILKAIKEENRILQMINHPNILKVHDFFINEQRGHCRLLTQLLPTYSLKNFITEKKVISEMLAQGIIFQIALAVHYLHTQHICHRDLNPSNIMINQSNNEITIIDFGVSKVFNNESKMWTPTGTPAYKAPEILKSEPYNENIDSWSIGIIFYELLSGKRPYYNESQQKYLKKMNQEDQSHLFQNPLWYNISTGSKDLISQLLKVEGNLRLSPLGIMNHPCMIRFLYKKISEDPENNQFLLIHPKQVQRQSQNHNNSLEKNQQHNSKESYFQSPLKSNNNGIQRKAFTETKSKFSKKYSGEEYLVDENDNQLKTKSEIQIDNDQ